MKYKKLQVESVWGIDFNPVDEGYTFIQDRPDTVFYKLLGQFLIDDELAVEGGLILSEEHLNEILAKCPITFRIIKENNAYTRVRFTENERVQWNAWEYKVEFVDFIECEEDEEDDDYTYGLVSMKEKKTKLVR